MSNAAQRLPLELILDVLDTLEFPQDGKTIEALSRVCRALLPIARRRLFTSLRLRAKEFARVSPEWEEWSGFLKPFHPDLSIVTHLYLQGQLRTSFVTSAQIETILSHLPRLRNLRLRGWDVTRFEYRRSILHDIKLDTLELIHLRCKEDTRGLLDVFGSLGSARILSVNRIEVEYDADDVQGDETSSRLDLPAQLAPTALSIRSALPCTRLVLDLFIHTGAVESVRRLEVGFFGVAGVIPAVGRFLENAQSLEELTFDLCEHFSLEMHSSSRLMDAATQLISEHLAPAFEACESLQSFTLHLPAAWRQHESFWEMCTTLLSVLPAGLRNLDVLVQGDSFFFDDVALDAALADLGELERFRVVAGRAFSAQAYRERVVKQLPRVAARGLLEVVTRDFV